MPAASKPAGAVTVTVRLRSREAGRLGRPRRCSRLDRRARGALDEVVDGRDDDHAAAASSIARPMSAVFAPSTSAVRGNCPPGSSCTNVLAAYGVLPRRTHRRGIRARHDARVDVARMPRDIGTSTGVNEMVGSTRPAQRSACAISGMWRCTPPTEYGFAEPRISLARRCALRLLRRRTGRRRAPTRGRGPRSRPRGCRGRARARRSTRCSRGPRCGGPARGGRAACPTGAAARGRRSSRRRGGRRHRRPPNRTRARAGGRRRSR
jgi:hypothetical protein